MKLYSFELHNWGPSFHVMSNSPSNALKAVQKFIKNRAIKYDYGVNKEQNRIWKKATLKKLPEDVVLVVKEPNEVIETENA